MDTNDCTDQVSGRGDDERLLDGSDGDLVVAGVGSGGDRYEVGRGRQLVDAEAEELSARLGRIRPTKSSSRFTARRVWSPLAKSSRRLCCCCCCNGTAQNQRVTQLALLLLFLSFFFSPNYCSGVVCIRYVLFESGKWSGGVLFDVCAGG